MAKLHSALTNAELHNPKGITSNSTASILELNQAQSAISSSADFVPTTSETYDLGSTTQVWKEIYVATSSINFVRPDGTILQQIKADEDGVIFTSGSGAVGNVSGSIISGSALHIQGNAKVTGDLTLGGQITMGDADTDDIVFEAEVSSSLIPNDDNAFDLGKASQQWKDLYVNGIGYIDQLGTDGDAVAAYISSGEIDGVTLGGESQVTITDADINGGTIDGVTIGVSSATTGNFTNISGSVVSASSGIFDTVDIEGGNVNLTNITGSTVSASTGIFTSVNIDGGTVDGITSLTAGGNLDIGAHGFRANTLTADNQTSGRVAVYGTAGLLSEDSDLSFSGATLSATNLTSTGTISGSVVYGTTLGQNTGGGLKTISIEANSIINQDLSTDADATLGTLSVGNVTSTGTVSGSAVYGTTLGQNTGGGLKTITLNESFTIGDGNDGTLTYSGASKTLTVEDDSRINQDLTSDASVTFAGVTSTGDITLTGQATDVDLIDNNASALSFDASGKTGILEIVTTNDAEKVKLSGGLEVEAQVTASGGVSGSFGHFTEIKRSTGTGLHELVLNETLTVSDGQNIILTGAGQENTLTLNESLTVGDGSSGTITYGAASKTLTIEDNATVDQDLTKDADVQFASATLTGRLTAQEIIVSSSVSYITASFASGSNILGDTTDDTHKVTGSLQITGSGDIVGNFTVGTDSAYTLGASGTQWSNVFTDNVTLDGQGRIDLDDDLDTSIRASADDVITIEAAGADQVAFTDGTIEPSTNDDIALGTSSKMFSDLFLGSGGVVDFNNGDMTIVHSSNKLVIGGGELRVAGLISGSTDLWIGSNSAYMSSSQGSLKLTGNIVEVGNITSTGTITGSAVYGTTLGQNRGDGLKTITIEANSTVNQDLTSDADVTFGTLAVGNVTSTGVVKTSGTLSGSGDFVVGALGGNSISASFTGGDASVIFRNTSGTTNISGSSVSASIGTFTTATIEGGTITGITDLTVADGGTGASTFTDGGVLLGSGTDAITAMAALGDGEMIVGDGSGDPVAESGATLRTSIGLGTGDSPTFTDLTLTGGDITLTAGATDIDLIDNNANALTFDAGAGGTSVLTIDTRNSAERIVVEGTVSASGDFLSKSTSTGSFGHLDVSTISGSGTVATFSSATIVDTPLPVSSGGTNATSLSDKAVLITQDSGDDEVGTAVMDGNGELIIGGTAGPAVMAASTLAGTGIDASTGDGTLTLTTSAAQTGISSIYNTSLKVGRDASGDWIDFGTDDNIKVYLNNVEEFRLASGGTFHADGDIVAFSSTVASDMNLKENITDTKYGLDTVMQLRGVEYDWKRKDMGHDVGVLAQEVEEVIPELVKDVDGLRGKFKAVDYNKLVPILIESIKELKTEVDSLKVLTEVEELK